MLCRAAQCYADTATSAAAAASSLPASGTMHSATHSTHVLHGFHPPHNPPRTRNIVDNRLFSLPRGFTYKQTLAFRMPFFFNRKQPRMILFMKTKQKKKNSVVD